jgi:MFS family permease
MKIHQMIVNRYLGLFVGCMAMVTAGSFATFALFGDAFVRKFGLTFQEINLVAAINICAQYVSYLAIGPIFDRYGEMVTQILSTFTLSFGYFLIYLSFADIIPSSTALLSFYYFIGGFGTCGVYMVVCGCIVHNFEANILGLVMGIVLLFYGISGLVYSMILTYGCAGDLESFLLVLFLSSLIVNSVGILTLKRLPIKIADPPPAESLRVQLLPPDAITSSPTGVSDGSPVRLPEVPPSVTSPLLQNSPTPSKSKQLDDLTPWEILKSQTFWYYAILCIMQQGLTYMVNINAIVRASYGPSVPVSRSADHITLISACQSIGRFSFGAGSDIAAKYNIDRTALLIVAEVLLFAAALIMAVVSDFTIFTSTPLLFVCSFLIGTGWGGGGGLLPPLTKQLFGLKYYGTANGFVMCGVPIGIFAFNYLFGALYDQQLQIQISEGGPKDFCYGGQCFKVALICTCIVQSIVLLLSILLYLKATKSTLFNWRVSG